MPHTDFHVYRRLRLYRRLNVLLYLNPGWRDDDGGALELWEGGGEEPVKAVAPDWGTCVIFETDTHSVHGFSTPVTPRGGWRRSIALYFYTSEDTDSFGGDANTIHLIDEAGVEDWPPLSKREVAERLAQRIAAFLERKAAE